MALPAPKKQLALPPPDPSKQLPSFAAKPKGGQWWSDKIDPNLNPEQVARRQAEGAVRFAGFVPAGDFDLGGVDTSMSPEQEWLAKSLARYYKNDFGSPEDPLRSLAEQGLHYEPDMTPEKWSAIVNSYLMADPIQDVLLPPNSKGGMRGAGSDLRGEVMVNMPWLAKQPVTDKVYGIASGGLDLSHFEDELYNALNADVSGIPQELALRPESLARMSFPQAVERVGRINQFRVKQMEEQNLAAANNPAIQTFKEYPEAGYRWVELRQPEYGPDMLPEGFGLRVRDNQQGGTYHALVDELDGGRELGAGQTPEAAIKAAQKWLGEGDTSLADALRFEGDTMGHCVGGYCDDVLSGRSRIFSLRDAKGQPHVTIEAAPQGLTIPPEDYNRIGAQARDEMEQRGLVGEFGDDFDLYDQALVRRERELREAWKAERAAGPMDIIQIKGKQNRAPVDDYLPYVQDFVKSGQWGNIGDFGNTGLVKLPDGRYITKQQLDEVINSPAAAQVMGSPDNARTNLAQWNLNTYNDDDWRTVGPLFEGYAIGGRVDASRCFSRNPLSVRAA